MLGAKGKVDFVISMAGIGVKGDTALTAQTNKILELTGQSMRFSTHQYRMNTIIKRSPWLNFFIDYDPSADNFQRRFVLLWLLMGVVMFR